MLVNEEELQWVEMTQLLRGIPLNCIQLTLKCTLNDATRDTSWMTHFEIRLVFQFPISLKKHSVPYVVIIYLTNSVSCFSYRSKLSL